MERKWFKKGDRVRHMSQGEALLPIGWVMRVARDESWVDVEWTNGFVYWSKRSRHPENLRHA